MKVGIFSIPEINPAKYNLKDERLDQVDNISKTKKKTYIQLELAGEKSLLEADALLALKDARADLVLKDLEFVETRLGHTGEEDEKALLGKLKNILEKEEFIFKAGLTQEEKEKISGYGLLTNKPVVLTDKEGLTNLDSLLFRILGESGFISFFTTGEKETRAWLIKQRTTAWEAAGVVHSDIQRGFIRAEVVSFSDFIQAGSLIQAKQLGKVRLEQKDYVMQDADLVNFRFNK
jgi:ribosome-binding ATPase YchF (GTP1/OBG family)